MCNIYVVVCFLVCCNALLAQTLAYMQGVGFTLMGFFKLTLTKINTSTLVQHDDYHYVFLGHINETLEFLSRTSGHERSEYV